MKKDVVHCDTTLVNKYINHLRDLKKFDKEMIDNISKMSNQDKMKIILSCVDVIEYLIDFAAYITLNK